MAEYVFSYHGDTERPRGDRRDHVGVERVVRRTGRRGRRRRQPVRAEPDGRRGRRGEQGNDARLSGYSVVRANDLDSAVAMARGCPVPAGGGSVVVIETVDM